MAYQLIKTTNSIHNIVLFTIQGPSRIYRKYDFRLVDEEIFMDSNIKIKYPEFIFDGGENSDTFNYLSIDNLRLYLAEDIYTDLSINNILTKGPYLYLNNMLEPIDLRTILKVEVFDSNGNFVKSWENDNSTLYTDQEKEIVNIVKNNPLLFKINEMYEGYVQLDIFNPKELIIFDNLIYYGSLRKDIPEYKVIKLNRINSIYEL